MQEEYMLQYWFLYFFDATFICPFLLAAVFYWSGVMKEKR
jgi:hypothetical protein